MATFVSTTVSEGKNTGYTPQPGDISMTPTGEPTGKGDAPGWQTTAVTLRDASAKASGEEKQRLANLAEQARTAKVQNAQALQYNETPQYQSPITIQKGDKGVKSYYIEMKDNVTPFEVIQGQSSATPKNLDMYLTGAGTDKVVDESNNFTFGTLIMSPHNVTPAMGSPGEPWKVQNPDINKMEAEFNAQAPEIIKSKVIEYQGYGMDVSPKVSFNRNARYTSEIQNVAITPLGIFDREKFFASPLQEARDITSNVARFQSESNLAGYATPTVKNGQIDVGFTPTGILRDTTIFEKVNTMSRDVETIPTILGTVEVMKPGSAYTYQEYQSALREANEFNFRERYKDNPLYLPLEGAKFIGTSVRYAGQDIFRTGQLSGLSIKSQIVPDLVSMEQKQQFYKEVGGSAITATMEAAPIVAFPVALAGVGAVTTFGAGVATGSLVTGIAAADLTTGVAGLATGAYFAYEASEVKDIYGRSAGRDYLKGLTDVAAFGIVAHTVPTAVMKGGLQLRGVDATSLHLTPFRYNTVEFEAGQTGRVFSFEMFGRKATLASIETVGKGTLLDQFNLKAIGSSTADTKIGRMNIPTVGGAPSGKPSRISLNIESIAQPKSSEMTPFQAKAARMAVESIPEIAPEAGRLTLDTKFGSYTTKVNLGARSSLNPRAGLGKSLGIEPGMMSYGAYLESASIRMGAKRGIPTSTAINLAKPFYNSKSGSYQKGAPSEPSSFVKKGIQARALGILDQMGVMYELRGSQVARKMGGFPKGYKLSDTDIILRENFTDIVLYGRKGSNVTRLGERLILKEGYGKKGYMYAEDSGVIYNKKGEVVIDVKSDLAQGYFSEFTGNMANLGMQEKTFTINSRYRGLVPETRGQQISSLNVDKLSSLTNEKSLTKPKSLEHAMYAQDFIIKQQKSLIESYSKSKNPVTRLAAEGAKGELKSQTKAFESTKQLAKQELGSDYARVADNIKRGRYKAKEEPTTPKTPKAHRVSSGVISLSGGAFNSILSGMFSKSSSNSKSMSISKSLSSVSPSISQSISASKSISGSKSLSMSKSLSSSISASFPSLSQPSSPSSSSVSSYGSPSMSPQLAPFAFGLGGGGGSSGFGGGGRGVKNRLIDIGTLSLRRRRK